MRRQLLRRGLGSLSQPQPVVAAPLTAAAAFAADIGQPSRETHPHLLRPGDLTPGIAASEYAARRAALLASLPDDSVVVLCSAPELVFPGTHIPVPSPYRQLSDTFYLTGLQQPGCVGVLQKRRGSSAGTFTLVMPPSDARHDLWHGARAGAASAVSHFGADSGEDEPRLGEVLRCALSSSRHVFVAAADGDPPPLSSAAALVALEAARGRAPAASPLGPLVAPLRWRKSPAEAALLRASAALSCAGLRRAAGAAAAGGAEAAPAAAHEAWCRAGGAARLAYPSVVAGGARGCAIHYGRYDGALVAGETLLMDAGCELHSAVSDVTRTFPVGPARPFPPPARRVYDAVLAAHAAALAAVRPGATAEGVHAAAVASLARSLRDLVGPAASRPGAYFRWFPHSTTHWLGLDTHDTPSVGAATPLLPGAVLTIEPGLYFRPDDDTVPRALRGLAVRIEDDVLVTPAGCEVLSSSAPTDAEGVEEWAAEARAAAAAAGGW